LFTDEERLFFESVLLEEVLRVRTVLETLVFDDEDVPRLVVTAGLFAERLSDAPAFTAFSEDLLPAPALATLSLVVLDDVLFLNDVLRPDSRLALRTEEFLPSDRTEEELLFDDDTAEREPDDEMAEREPDER
jgi:hypothetical protein